jgi:hypothetical protein
MNRVILAVLTVMIASSLAFAQGAQSSGSDFSSAAGNFAPHTFRGCLSQTGTQYELTSNGAVPRRYRLVGSNLAQLDGKAGHTVSIVGTVPDSLLVAETNPVTDTINFLSVDDLALSCNVSGDLGPGSEMPYSTAAAISFARPESLPSLGSFLLLPDWQTHQGSYMLVPIVGALTLGLLQFARSRRPK